MMENYCKIAETGLVGMLQEMKNPLTNINLCLELLESGGAVQHADYYAIIKKSALEMESSIREICSCFLDQGFALQLAPLPLVPETVNI